MGCVRIGLVCDVATEKTDGTITSGGILDVTGNKIRCINAEGTGMGAVRFLNTETRQEVDNVSLLAINDPKRIMFAASSLEDGAYILQIETCFSSSSMRLKQARLIDYPVTLYVGARPDEGDDDDDRPVIE